MNEVFRGVDYQSTDPDEILEAVRRLTVAAHRFNLRAVADFGGRSGPERLPGLVAQAVGAAFQTFAGFDPHPEPFEKAAMLLRGITQGHPFDDGNKRTGFLTAAYYLAKCGHDYPAHLDPDAAVAFCMALSAGEVRDVAAIAAQLRGLWWA